MTQRTSRLWFASAATCIGMWIGPGVARACPVCYGDPESEMVRGAVWGVAVLGVIVYGVVMGMVGIGVTWFVRARKLAGTQAELSLSRPAREDGMASHGA